jgi:hypothetical protein
MRWVEAAPPREEGFPPKPARRVRWAPYPADWRRVAEWVLAAAEAGDPVGFDTEFAGVDIKHESVLAASGRPRAGVHVWSLGLLTKTISPRGNRKAMGVVLPGEALHHPHIRGILTDPDIVKLAHNAPVDAHAVDVTAGYRPVSLVNTLSQARWVLPGLKERGGFGLKNMMPLVGREPFAEYKVLMKEILRWEVGKVRVRKVCSCGVEKCLKRKGHTKSLEEWTEYSMHEKVVPVDLFDVVPGHPLWLPLLVYAGEDAEAAPEIWDFLRRRGRKLTVNNPFLREVA